MRKRAVSSAYVHIPFCRQKCRYCDFPIDVSPASRFEERAQRYVDCLVREVEEGGAGAFTEDFETEPLKSLYFGGGTPSLLPLKHFVRIFQALEQRFGMDADCEVTVEMDPGTFTKETVEDLVSLGMQRASVGVQSLTDAQLAQMGRGHDALSAVEALELLRPAVRKLSADLLCGVPGQTQEELVKHLQQLESLGVDHLSVYDLQYEPGTSFASRFPKPGHDSRPSEEEAAQLYEAAHWELEKLGFEHYEVSNYAKSVATRSRHNQIYWSGDFFAAFGLGASSFVTARAARPRSLESYCDWVEAGGGQGCELDESPTHLADAMLEATMLSLRTSEGLDLAAASAPARRVLRAIYGALKGWEEAGAVSCSFDGERLRAKLRQPKGFLVSDALLSDAFAAVMRL